MPKRTTHSTRRPDLRRHRHRRRPQRPGQRRLPRQGRAQDADPRAAPSRRRRGDHRGAPAGLLVHDVLVRPEPAAAGHHPGPRARQARLHADPDADDVLPDGERRLPAARPGPRREPAGDRPPQPARRRRATTRYNHDIDKVIQAIKPLLDMAPPDIFSDDPEELIALAGLGSALPRGSTRRSSTTRSGC